MREHVFTAVAWAPGAELHVLEQAVPHAVEIEKEWVRGRDLSATKWATRHAQADGSKFILRVPSHADQYRRGRDALGDFAKRATVVTNRGRAGGRGTTLVPNAYPQEIEGGMNSADGGGLVVTEHPAFPLIGWAMHVGALNLRTGERTVDVRSDEQRDLITHLISGLYNGWSSEPGRWMAPKYLSDLAESGLAWSVFVGALLATSPHSYDAAAIKKLAPTGWLEEIESRREVFALTH